METAFADEPPSLLPALLLQATGVMPGWGYWLGMAATLVALLLLSALISGAEVAFFSIELHDLDEMRQSKHKADKRVTALLDNPKYLLATILILNNFVNVAIVTLSTYLTWQLFAGVSQAKLITILTFVVTFVIVFFGEIVPKIYATKQHLAFARKTSALLYIGRTLVKPLAWILVNLTTVVERRLQQKTNGPEIPSSIKEVHEALEITTRTGISEKEKSMLRGIVNFGTIPVTQVMRSRVDIVAVEDNINFHELMDTINKEGHSRIPVFHEDIDNIKGILYVKDLLPYIDEDEHFAWQELLRPAYFVPESKMIDDLLREFQAKRIHIAIVVDEYGGTSGLITMEDILEEIVGEINDEFDDVERFYRKVGEGVYDFEGRTSINDVCKVLKVEPTYFDEIRGESESLGGMLLEVLGELPNTGETVNYRQYEFTILAVDKRRIKKVRVKSK